ncbi:hypothetical protein BKA62DRAFT_772559 [Auriculariales sp. MPI-PUGE-AT-0066]|nr:hypothetical protein BKA62DRAFT_772559 [Auriculariales sp. MPI-PUGE-AT-0066]
MEPEPLTPIPNEIFSIATYLGTPSNLRSNANCPILHLVVLAVRQEQPATVEAVHHALHRYKKVPVSLREREFWSDSPLLASTEVSVLPLQDHDGIQPHLWRALPLATMTQAVFGGGMREPTRLSVINATAATTATASLKKKKFKFKAAVMKPAVESAAKVAAKRKRIRTRVPSSPSPTPSQLSDVPSIFTSSSLTSPTSSVIARQLEKESAFTDSPGRATFDHFDLFNDSDRDGEYNLRLLAVAAEAAAAATRPMSLAERYWHPHHDGSAWPSANFLQPQPADRPGTETSDAEDVTGRLQPCDWQHGEDEEAQLPTVDEYLRGDSYQDTPAAQFQQSQRLPTVEEYLGSDSYEELAQETEAVVEQRRRGALKIKIVFRGHAVCELNAVCL